MGNKKKYLNIIFIIIILLAIITIVLFNYIIDPYKIFHKNYKAFSLDKKEFYDIYINHQKNISKGILFIGASELAASFSLPFYTNYYFDKIVLTVSTFEQIYTVVEKYLDTLTNTKQLYLYIPYSCFYIRGVYTTPLNISKTDLYYKLFLSKETFRESTDSLIEKIHKTKSKFLNKNNNLQKMNHVKIESNETITARPKTITKIIQDKNNQLYKSAINNIEKINNLTKKNNTKFTVIIPPFSALYLSNIYLYPETYNQLENFKRFLVNNDIEVYDFSKINKYTKENILKHSYLYLSPDHPNLILGIKIFKVFFDKENAENDIYVVLNKNNIEKELIVQRKEIEEFIRNNKELIDEYKDLQKTEEGFFYREKFRLIDIPENYKKEILYIREKEKELDNNI